MRLIIQNEYGKFEIGGFNHPIARLQQCNGLGTIKKKINSVNFVGQIGSTVQSIEINERTITLKFDFYGDAKKVEDLYKILSESVELVFVTDRYRRKIKGYVIVDIQTSNIIYGAWQDVIIQFFCPYPYFNDLEDIILPVSRITNKFPNLQESDGWYIQLPAVATEQNSSSIITNYGDTILYPIFIIKGMDDVVCDSIIIKNKTTDKQIVINRNIAKNEEIIIDLPNRKIKSSVSGDITKYISDDTILSDFFLNVGDNEIEVTSSNALKTIIANIQYNNNYVSVVL